MTVQVNAAEDDEAGRKLELAREADQTYRAERHAELSHRMRGLLRLLAFLESNRLHGLFLNLLMGGIGIGALLIAVGIVRGDRVHDLFPWEVEVGVVTILVAFAVPFAITAAKAKLQQYVQRSFERNGLTFDDPRRNRRS